MRWLYVCLMAFVLSACGGNKTHVVLAPEHFSGIIERIENNQANNIHALVVWQDNKKIVEVFREGGGRYGHIQTSKMPIGRDALHNVHSVTKSFVATLIFIAIDEGRLANLDVPVFSLFPEYQKKDSQDKMAITVRHVLNMSTGYALNEHVMPYGIGNPFQRHYAAKDLEEMFLNTTLRFEPGSQFCYSGLSTIGLSKVIERIYGKPFATVMREKLFEPLGISNYRWINQLGSGEPGADWGLMTDSESMGKFGLMLLNNGKWEGKQIIASEWVQLIKYSEFNQGVLGYGMHFWQLPQLSSAYAAMGYGEQYIIVIPSKHAVIVTTGGNYNQGHQILNLAQQVSQLL
ncbi:serine hydrolase [Vibrio sp. S9_S30]|uniref:serine hydrolase domain-containing protein n=1 Tax=Vibrio sp. S9_S30 TaxID=2720226 RepID=UPI001681A121|nr:serine hydrolase [Vibrio sp. S9_S30]MBD1558258.1 serine hydrolase [Vibrio sp. S9_S30]